MKYLKKFNQENDYSSFKNSENWITPNICAIIETQKTKLNKFVPPPPPPAMYGDIVYWNGSKVDYVNKTKWNADLGTPLGVVVVPEGFATDGKARFVALNAVDASGNTSTSEINMKWGDSSTDTSLTNFTKVPTTDNSGSTSTGSNTYGYLPSDKFTGNQSFVDAKAKYSKTSNLIPSPYLTVDSKDTPNPEYNKEISGYNNALSDFSGLSNTETLVGLGSDYVAANAAWNYRDGLSNVQYYLPAMGELGYLMPRFNEINDSLSLIGGVVVGSGSTFWSSSEYSSSNAYCLGTGNGRVYDYRKTSTWAVRPFGFV
jgi:hypothetical protein